MKSVRFNVDVIDFVGDHLKLNSAFKDMWSEGKTRLGIPCRILY